MALLTNYRAPISREVLHVRGYASSVYPVAAIECHDCEANHGPVGQHQPPSGCQPEPRIAAEMLQQAPQQHHPGTQ